MPVLNSMQQWFSGIWQRWGGYGWGRMRLLLPGARFDYEREAGDLWQNSIAAIALGWLGDRAHRPDVRVAKLGSDGNWTPKARHDAVNLWERPNPFYTRQTLERAVLLSLVTDGNALIQKVRARSGKVVQLWWIPSFLASPRYPADGSSYLGGWRVRIDAQYYDLEAADVIHVRRGIDPRNDRLGLAPLKAQLREVCADNEVSVYTAALLRNGGVPGLMIVPDDERMRPTSKDAEQIKERVADAYTGEGRGSAIVLGGKYKVEAVGFSPEQLALDKLPQQAMARLAAAVGVPLMAMGLPDPGKTYNNVEQAIKIGWGTVEGMQCLVADGVRWQLLSEFDDSVTTRFEYDYTHITELQEDLAAKSARMREEYKTGVRTREECREDLGLAKEPEGETWFPGTVPMLPSVEDADTTQTVGADPVADVQATALNGAQITSLVDLIAQVTQGTLPAESARAIIAASFPMLSPEEIDAIVRPLSGFKPETPEPAPAPALPPSSETDEQLAKAALELLGDIRGRLPFAWQRNGNGHVHA